MKMENQKKRRCCRWNKLCSTTALAMFVMFYSAVAADFSGTVYGVGENGQRVPLARATVRLLGTQTGTYTNNNGEFSISATAAGSLVVSYAGYATDTVALKPAGEKIEVDLKPSGGSRNVNVTARQASMMISGSSIVKTEITTGRGLMKAACAPYREFCHKPFRRREHYRRHDGQNNQMLGLQARISMLTEKTPVCGIGVESGWFTSPGMDESIQCRKATLRWPKATNRFRSDKP
jgi:hypothetical protein